MYFAENGKISTEVLPNGIQITEDQYREALQAMMEGKEVSIDNGFEILSPEAEEVPNGQPKYKTQFTSLEYLDRFTEEEEDLILLASEVNLQVRKFYNRLLAATFIDVEDPRTGYGLQALIDADLLAPERKDELLAPQLIED